MDSDLIAASGGETNCSKPSCPDESCAPKDVCATGHCGSGNGAKIGAWVLVIIVIILALVYFVCFFWRLVGRNVTDKHPELMKMSASELSDSITGEQARDMFNEACSWSVILFAVIYLIIWIIIIAFLIWAIYRGHYAGALIASIILIIILVALFFVGC